MRKTRKTRKTSRTPTKPTNVPEIPKEFQETTMQMPIGVGSLFWAVECRVLTPAEGMTIAFSTAHSNWNTGKTHAKSYNQIAIALQISQAYVKQLIKRVSDWMRSVKQTTKGKIYQLVSHVVPEDTPEDQFPYDENGRPLKFAVPIGDGSPFDRLCQGHISWQACWLWLIMKRNSNWKPGENGGVTFSLSYKTLSKHSGLGTATIQRAIKQLKTAGMLKRLSLPHEAGIYQLYPKPAPRPVKRTKQASTTDKTRLPRRTHTHYYSLNEQYRIEIQTGQFDLKRRKQWKPANRDQVPTHIRIDLEAYQEAAALFTQSGVTDSTPNVTHDPPSVTDSTPNGFFAPPQPSGAVGF